MHVAMDFGLETFRERHRRFKIDLLLTLVISNLCGFGSRIKTLIFAISDFFQLLYAQNLKSFEQRCVKVFIGKSLGNNTVPVIFYIKL